MLFAVVDIETTGSHASANGITEIGIVIHDGEKVLDFFETLINPRLPIPYFIERLTGITDAMVVHAPTFAEVAAKIYELLQDKVFVAHNVNFDYSFVKYHLDKEGYVLNSNRLCTVRLARKFLPGLPSYSLSKLTHQLKITHSNHHRAGGDALATADLLKMVVAKDTKGEIAGMLKANAKEQYLPPHLPVEQITSLPPKPGIYYLYDATGKPIYIGKAVNLKKRVVSHFSNNKPGKQKQDFLRETHKVSYKICATDLMAHIMESIEIRRLWPKYNRSQRGYLPQYGLYAYTDTAGYCRLAIEKWSSASRPAHTFNSLYEGTECLKELMRKFDLCSRLCNLSAGCSCTEHAPQAEYNQHVALALEWLHLQLPSFAYIDKGIEDNHYSCILVVEGIFYGMGYIANLKKDTESIAQLQQLLEPMPHNDYIRNLIMKHATDFPYNCVHYS